MQSDLSTADNLPKLPQGIEGYTKKAAYAGEALKIPGAYSSTGKDITIQTYQKLGTVTLNTEQQSNLLAAARSGASTLASLIKNNYLVLAQKVYGIQDIDELKAAIDAQPYNAMYGIINEVPMNMSCIPDGLFAELKTMSRPIYGAKVGKGGSLFRTIKLPKGLTNKIHVKKQPQPFMLLMQLSNFIWRISGLGQMAPGLFTRACIGYFRAIGGKTNITLSLTTQDIADIFTAVKGKHPALFAMFVDNMSYSYNKRKQQEQIKAQLAAARATLIQQIANGVKDVQGAMAALGSILARIEQTGYTSTSGLNFSSVLTTRYANVTTQKKIKKGKFVTNVTSVGEGDETEFPVASGNMSAVTFGDEVKGLLKSNGNFLVNS